MKLVGTLTLLLLAVGASWWVSRSPDEPEAPKPVAKPAIASTAKTVPGASSAPAAPAAPGLVRSNQWHRPTSPAKATLYSEYLRATELKPLYDRLKGSPEAETADGKLVMYEILKECTEQGRKRGGNRGFVPTREKFVERLSSTDPQRDKRIAAYDDLVRDKCGGFEGMSTSSADLMKLLESAAAMGSPNARAVHLEQQLLQQRRESGDGRVTLNDAQVRSLQEIASSKDPEAIRAAGRVLSTGWNDYALRFAGDPTPLEARPLMNAWMVLACEYGSNCGADTPRMQQACALQGYCDAEAFPDFLFHYANSPHDTQLMMQYREVLRSAIESGNWSRVTVVRGPEAGGGRGIYWPGFR